MDKKLMELFKTGRDIILRFLKGEAKREDLATVLTVIIAALTIVASVIGIIHILPYAVTAAVIALIFMPSKKETKAPPVPYELIVFRAIVDAVNRIYKTVGLRPIDRDEEADSIVSSSVSPEGIKRMVFRMKVQNPSGSCNADWTEIVMKIIQQEINSMLRTGKIAGIPTPSIDGIHPIIFIDEVIDMGTHVEVVVIFVDNKVTLDYVRNKNSQLPPQCPIDEDF